MPTHGTAAAADKTLSRGRFITFEGIDGAGKSSQIAAVVAFVASDDASHLNGAVIPIDGGVSAQRAAPRSFDVVQSSGAG